MVALFDPPCSAQSVLFSFICHICNYTYKAVLTLWQKLL